MRASERIVKGGDHAEERTYRFGSLQATVSLSGAHRCIVVNSDGVWPCQPQYEATALCVITGGAA